jgi:hypothetical protein
MACAPTSTPCLFFILFCFRSIWSNFTESSRISLTQFVEFERIGFEFLLMVAVTRNDLQTLGLGALVFDLEITSHRFSADVERVALARLPIGQHP